jgi:hypothetical protein
MGTHSLLAFAGGLPLLFCIDASFLVLLCVLYNDYCIDVKNYF